MSLLHHLAHSSYCCKPVHIIHLAVDIQVVLNTVQAQHQETAHKSHYNNCYWSYKVHHLDDTHQVQHTPQFPTHHRYKHLKSIDNDLNILPQLLYTDYILKAFSN